MTVTKISLRVNIFIVDFYILKLYK